MFSKIEVNGDGAHPLWKWLKDQPKGRGTLGNAIKWNFTKFLINREGLVVKRFSPMDDPVVSWPLLFFLNIQTERTFILSFKKQNKKKHSIEKHDKPAQRIP
ncbi:phospholipid hydroperoxide glutathione peroxidase, mitochondrial [Pelobates cultripes]|uniref:phospholipid-hydroperoxide glutathione peroxidase n=1 Tax=Pelobates cultripes TaxID=61616 RepID=A0AAD1W8D9_PELCU|nr:phospholipid hydroperoxide glutathione peroxidase, mitochondrial [Pelobates cultripes]